MRIKTSELSGIQLDWAVAKCEAVDIIPPERGQRYLYSQAFGNCYAPSRACAGGWNISGPIIERERIASECTFVDGQADGNRWFAEVGSIGESFMEGPTALIAAMRCYVASRLGDEVDIPEELK